MEALIAAIIVAGVQLLMGFILKNFSDQLKDLARKDSEMGKELTDVKINYVHKQDLKDLKEEISARFVDLKQWIKEELKGQ